MLARSCRQCAGHLAKISLSYIRTFIRPDACLSLREHPSQDLLLRALANWAWLRAFSEVHLFAQYLTRSIAQPTALIDTQLHSLLSIFISFIIYSNLYYNHSPLAEPTPTGLAARAKYFFLARSVFTAKIVLRDYISSVARTSHPTARPRVESL